VVVDPLMLQVSYVTIELSEITNIYKNTYLFRTGISHAESMCTLKMEWSSVNITSLKEAASEL